jgi:hypothetical protein
MTGFAPLLNDKEIAAVITYVRQSFKNDLDSVKGEDVKRIRKAIDAKAGVYTVEELLKEHPITGGEAPKAK